MIKSPGPTKLDDKRPPTILGGILLIIVGIAVGLLVLRSRGDQQKVHDAPPNILTKYLQENAKVISPKPNPPVTWYSDKGIWISICLIGYGFSLFAQGIRVVPQDSISPDA